MIITGCLFGIQFLFNKYALTTLDPIGIGFGRVAIGFFTLMILLPFFPKQAKHKKSTAIPWHKYAILGFFEGTLPCLVLPLGQLHTDSAIAAILISTMPFFAIIFAAMMRLPGEQLSLHKIASIVIGFIGVVFIIHPTTLENIWREIGPELLILLASASWGLGLSLIRKLPSIHPIRLCRNLLFWAAIETAIIWVIFGHPFETRFTPLSFWSLIILGTINAGVVYIFYVLLVRYAGVAFASFSNYIVPIVGLGLGAYILHEKITWVAIVGLVIVFAGLALNSFYIYKEQK